MSEVVVVQPQQYAVTIQPLQYSVVVQLPGPQGPAGGGSGGGSSWTLDLLNANGLALSGANALSLALVSSGSPGAMSIADKAILDAATDANINNALVRRDLAGRFATTRITMPTGSGNGLIIGSVNIYEQTGGFIRVGGSLSVDGSFNGSGSGLTLIPNSSVVGLGTGALKNADNSANNLPVLDSSGLLASSCFPPLVVIDTNVVNSQAAMLALTAQKGDIAIRTDNGKTYILSTNSPTILADWKEITAAGVVTTVNGFTGTVVLTTSDVGEGSQQYFTVARALAALGGGTFAGTLTGGTFTGTHTGNGSGLTSLNGSNISSGTVAPARLASVGTPDGTHWLRGDGVWAFLKYSMNLAVQAAKLPTTNPARIDASEQNWRLLFDAATSQSAIWQFVMPNSWSGNFTVTLIYSMNTVQAGTNSVVWRITVAKDTPSSQAEDVNVAVFDTANSFTSALAANQPAGYARSAGGVCTTVDSLSAGDFIQMKIDRDAANVSDTATGDAELIGILIEWN